VRRSALRRATGAWAVLSICALLLGSGIVGTTFAYLNGETQNPSSSFAAGWVAGASSGTATVAGSDVQLNWTPPPSGGEDTETLKGADNGSNSNCTGAAYSSVATVASTNATALSTSSYIDANRANGSNGGHYYCYELVNAVAGATNWTTTYVFPSAVRLGLAPTGVSITNGGSANAIDTGDQIAITFNQATNLTTLSGVLTCAFTDGTILIGDQSACLSSSDSYSIGKLTAGSGVIGSSAIFATTGVSISGSTATVTLAGVGSAAITGTPSWTFTASTSILSSATTDQATACTGSTCQPTVASAF
jgi:hypothetical protein